MGEIVRFGVSLEAELLTRFDELCTRRGYASRSEALRDMIRETLVQDALACDDVPAAGVLTLVYDHHIRDLSRKLTERQHAAHHRIVATLHVHLDHDSCLEMLVLQGPAGELRTLADALRAIRGVKYGAFAFTPTEQGAAHEAH